MGLLVVFEPPQPGLATLEDIDWHLNEGATLFSDEVEQGIPGQLSLDAVAGLLPG
mgnify:CR=1 FL=1